MRSFTITYSVFKTIVSTSKLPIYWNVTNSGYFIQSASEACFYAAKVAGSDIADFEANLKISENEGSDEDEAAALASVHLGLHKKEPKQDGKSIGVVEKSTASKVTFFSHDWTDPTTWYTKSVKITDEVATYVSSGVYQLAHVNVIDAYHGKLTQEDYLNNASGGSYRVSVKVDGAAVVEQDPHYGTGEDYTLNYATGVLTFIAGEEPAQNAEIKVTYHYATTSEFIIKPVAGKKLLISFAECQFSQDVAINDTVVFQPYGYVDYFAPQYLQSNGGPYPSGTKIPLGAPAKYKAMSDYYNESVKAYATYPALGGNGWRGASQPITTCDWDYVASTPISSSAGMEIVISLEHHTPFGGDLATATFYCTVESE